ncbi:MAG: M48 family metallopeptidase [Candidatus Rokuibacteriota bacterium]
MIWHGHYLDGRSAERRPATVHIVPGALDIAAEGAAGRRWPLAEIRQTQGAYRGEPVRLERRGAPTEVLIVDDVRFLTALRGAAGRPARFHDLRRRGRRVALILAAAVAALAATVGLYRWGIPAAAGAAARFVPVAWEVRMGDEVFARLFAPERRCADPERQRVIDAIVERLVAGGAGGPYRVRVAVVDQPQVNALAFPGGRVVLLRGLLEATDSAEMLAGVLAHEIQHVVRRHATRAILQHASTGILVAAVAGDVSGLVTFALEGARVVAALGYSRQAEDEADAHGLRMLLTARIDPAPAIDFYDKVLTPLDARAPRGAWRYVSTHPATGERVAVLRAIARTTNSAPVALFPGGDWADVKRICGG